MQKPQEMQVQSLGRDNPLEEEMAPTPVFLPGESHGQSSLVGHSLGSERVRHNWVTEHICILAWGVLGILSLPIICSYSSLLSHVSSLSNQCLKYLFFNFHYQSYFLFICPVSLAWYNTCTRLTVTFKPYSTYLLIAPNFIFQLSCSVYLKFLISLFLSILCISISPLKVFRRWYWSWSNDCYTRPFKVIEEKLKNHYHH